MIKTDAQTLSFDNSGRLTAKEVKLTLRPSLRTLFRTLRVECKIKTS
ncbi:hypothetical protein [Prevotella sp. P2-180]|nr:hypothetical protein [Prevotella sp. P2-180]